MKENLNEKVRLDKYTIFRDTKDNTIYCVRNLFPRFSVQYKPERGINNARYLDFKDNAPDATEMKELMREISKAIAIFLQEEK